VCVYLHLFLPISLFLALLFPPLPPQLPFPPSDRFELSDVFERDILTDKERGFVCEDCQCCGRTPVAIQRRDGSVRGLVRDCRLQAPDVWGSKRRSRYSWDYAARQTNAIANGNHGYASSRRREILRARLSRQLEDTQSRMIYARVITMDPQFGIPKRLSPAHVLANRTRTPSPHESVEALSDIFPATLAIASEPSRFNVTSKRWPPARAVRHGPFSRR